MVKAPSHSNFLLILILLCGHSIFCFQNSHFSPNAHGRSPSLVTTMMLRDEEVNIQEHLPLWMEYTDYFVFGIDSNSTDGTENAIHSLLQHNPTFKDRYHIFRFNFTGFGPVRTLTLQESWKKFPQASHVWVADPDWKPEVLTIDKKRDLDFNHDVFQFTILDRNGFTVRRCDWILLHREGLSMRYNLHEVLNYSYHYSQKLMEWTVHEIDRTHLTWHGYPF